MRIAIVSTPFVAVPPRDYGGTELVVYELVQGLTERGHDVTLFATGDSRTSAEQRALYDLARWPPDPFTDLNQVSWALQQVVEGRFDVVHVNSPAALAFSRLLPGLPLVYTLHHGRDDRLSEYYLNFPEVHFVAISADQRRREVPLPRCDVIHHGLHPARFQCRERPGPALAFVGRLSREKGPHTAIDVAARAGLRIQIAGRPHPPDREFAARELERRLALRHVSYLGVIGLRTKVPLLRDARALLAPIEWEEPFGLILIEAMLSGCPVVAFPRGSVPELVDPGVTGYVVDSADEMVEVVRPGGPLDRFDRLRCRRRASQRFSRARLVRDHERLYARVAAESAAVGQLPFTAA
jgi:glycosyltransferase involved in cell wall biosynthesis